MTLLIAIIGAALAALALMLLWANKILATKIRQVSAKLSKCQNKLIALNIRIDEAVQAGDQAKANKLREGRTATGNRCEKLLLEYEQLTGQR